MSHPAICAGAATRPYPNEPGSAAPAKPTAARRMAATARQILRELYIEDAPVRFDLPGLDRIVVIDRVRAALLPQLRNRRLHITGLVDDAGGDQRRAAVPAPGQSEFCECLRQHRLVQPCGLPADPAIRGDIDAFDPAVAGPGEPPDLIEAGPIERLFRAGKGDDRFGIDQPGEAARGAIRHQVGVFRGFLARMPWFVAELDPAQPLDV